MSLRPRYSLLTLLVLTAFIAGGVKLWYGPHHVVERPVLEEEIEYTYTHNWRGERVIEGPQIRRIFNDHHALVYLAITFYREGQPLPWLYYSHVVPEGDPIRELSGPVKLNLLWGIPPEVPPTPEEQVMCEKISAQDWQDLATMRHSSPKMRVLHGVIRPLAK